MRKIFNPFRVGGEIPHSYPGFHPGLLILKPFRLLSKHRSNSLIVQDPKGKTNKTLKRISEIITKIPRGENEQDPETN